MNIVAIIQARTGSTRLPNKILLPIIEKPLIWHIFNRLSFCNKINKAILATTINSNDDILVDWAIKSNIEYFRGSENNVLERYYETAKKFEADIIVRITADDPFKDPQIIDKVIEMLISKDLDFAYNNNPPTFPEGLDTEVFTFKALETAYQMSIDNFEKEHVTQYFYKNKSQFKQDNFSNLENLSHLRWTIDTDKDLEMTRMVYEELYKESYIFFSDDILNLIRMKPEISKINQSEKRSEMYKNLNI